MIPRIDAVPPLAERDFEDDFVEACRAAADGRSGDAFRSGAVREVHPRVFALRMLRPAACERLLAIIEARRALVPGAAPNSMHDHGALLAPLGFEPLLADLRARWIAPLAARWLPEFAGGGLDAHHGYLVEYARDRDEELGFHVDDSEVTLNLCLGDRFEGAELTLLGLRCDLHRQTPVRRDEVFEHAHEPGLAVLHAGRHRHRVEPIVRGSRRNLILWCRDSAARAAAARPAACAPWCGVLASP